LRTVINPLVPSDTFALKLSYLGKTRAVKKAARISWIEYFDLGGGDFILEIVTDLCTGINDKGRIEL
jgi:hypothetical protein